MSWSNAELRERIAKIAAERDDLTCQVTVLRAIREAQRHEIGRLRRQLEKAGKKAPTAAMETASNG